MAIETTESWRNIEEIILAQLGKQSPLLADALLNQCAFAYYRQGGGVQLLLPDYNSALERLTKQKRIAYDREKGRYYLSN